MKHWKTPPTIKIYEALGAVADGRMESVSETGAIVWSSDRSKYYDISYDPPSGAIMTNDNGSYWQGYLGYPSIAYLMKRGVLPYDAEIAELLKGIAWKEINVANKNDYEKTIADILDSLERKEENRLVDYVEGIEKIISERRWLKLGKRARPPQ